MRVRNTERYDFLSNIIPCYCPQQSWGKVIFSEVCVKNSVYKGGLISQHALQVSKPTAKAEVEGSGRGVSGFTPRGVCISACTEIDIPLAQQIATAAGGMHPTGMHSGISHGFNKFVWIHRTRVIFESSPK